MKFLLTTLLALSAAPAFADGATAYVCRITEKVGAHESQISDVPLNVGDHATINLVLYPKISLALSVVNDGKGDLITMVATDLNIPGAKSPQDAQLASFANYTYFLGEFKVGETRDRSVQVSCNTADNS